MSKIVLKEIGCSFRVFRKTTSRKVIGLSLWKKDSGYVFNLSNTIMWWGRNTKVLFPGWNVRLYIDNSVFSPMKNDVDWNMIIEQIKKHRNVEIWLYDCEWGHSKKSPYHDGTFGSILRFHPFQDPTVDIAISRNVEMLSSIKDARIVHDWVNSNRQYHIMYDMNKGYPCFYNNKELCQKLGLSGTNMIVAWFGMKKPNPYHDMFHIMRELILDNYQELRKYPYGTDEILLTKLFKDKMTSANTYTTPRNTINQIFPFYNFTTMSANKNYLPLAKLIFDFFRSDNPQLPIEMINRTDLIPLFEETDNLDRVVSQLNPLLGKLEDRAPDILVILLKYLRNKLRKSIDIQEAENVHRAMMNWYFKLFKNDGLNYESSLDDLDTNFMLRVNSPQQALIFSYVAISTVIFEQVDFPGLVLKMKTYDVPIIEDSKITEDDIKTRIRRIKRMFRSKKSDDELRERAIRELNRDRERNKQKFLQNKEIFDRNIKNIWILRDSGYV